MRPILLLLTALAAFSGARAEGQELGVVAELPGATGQRNSVFVISLARNGPKFVVSVTSTSILSWPVGRVSEPVVSVLPGSPWAGGAVFADFDGDGLTDVAVSRLDEIDVLRGDGTGRFTNAATVATDFQPHTLVAADFDGDGRVDLLTVPSDQTPTPLLFCFLSRGGFTFAAPRTTVVTSLGGVSWMTAGDLDADGRADLVVNPDQGSGSIWRSSGDGTFSLMTTRLDGYHAGLPILADIDGDGLPDIVYRNTYPFPPFPIFVYKNDGGGRFHLLGSVSTSPYADSPFVADVDGDGRLEIAFLERSLVRRPYVSIWKFVGDAPAETRLLLPDTRMTIVGAVDWYGDGRTEYVGAGADRLQIFGTTGSRTDVSVVPVLLSTTGVLGARFDSDLLLTNSGTAPAHATLRYTPSAGGGSGTIETDLGPGRQLFAPSAIAFLRAEGLAISNDGNVIGTLRMEVVGASSPGAVSASVRTTSPSGAGVAFGDSSLVSLLREPAVIPWLVETSKDRTNLGLVNGGGPADGPVTLRVEIHDADGVTPPAVLPDVVLPPGAFSQIGRVLASAGQASRLGWARVTRIAGSAPYLAWAAVNDAGSGDGSFVPAVPESADFNITWVVPSAVQTTRYATEFVATNPGPYPMALRVTLVATGTVLEQALDPGATFYLQDFFAELRRRGLPGAPAPDASVVSPLYVQTRGFQRVFAGVRVSGRASEGRSYGVFEAAAPQDSLLSFSAIVPDVRQNASTRTNLGIVNVYGAPMTFRVEIVDGDTGSLVATREDLLLAPNELRQLDSALLGLAPGTTRAWARVTPVSLQTNRAVFAAYAVVNDGPAPGLGTGDGSFVPGLPR